MARRSFLATLSASVAAACSPLGTLNGLNNIAPGDRGAARIARGVAFGPDARQRLDIYAPVNGSGGNPVLMFFYGGSWASGYRQGYAFAAKAFASRGYTVVVPDYRLVPDVHFPAFVEDGAAAIAWTLANIAEYGADPAHVSLIGHSAGAYIAMMLALDTRWLTAAGASPAYVRAAVGLAGPYDFYPFAVGATRAAFGRAPDGRATQPVNFARADAPPILLAYGEDDKLVLPRNSLALADALGKAGAPVTVRAYPDVGHVGLVTALSKPFRSRAPVLADTLAFLRQHG